MARGDVNSSKDPNKDVFIVLSYGTLIYLIISGIWNLPEISKPVSQYVPEGISTVIADLLVFSATNQFFVKIGFLVTIVLFAKTDDFMSKRNIVERYEKKPMSYINRHILMISCMMLLFFALSQSSLISNAIVALMGVGLIINRDFGLTLAFKFPKHKESILNFLNAQFHDTNSDFNEHGYHTINYRQQLLNHKEVGHHEDKLAFYHKFKKGQGIEVLYNGNPRRGNGVIGTAGSGKTYSILDPMAIQTIRDLHIPMAEYDFKFPNMARVAFHSYMRTKKLYEKENKEFTLRFATTTFTNEFIHNTWRINPISSETVKDSNDAQMYMKTFLQCFNKKWQQDDSDFWFKSTYGYGSGIIEMFAKYMGEHFTFAHILQFLSRDYEDQVGFLIESGIYKDEDIRPKVEAVVKPVKENKAADQVSGIFSTLQNDIGQMNNPAIFFALSGNDASLHVNDPNRPELLILGNSNKYKKVFGPIISLYYSIIFNVCNTQNQLPLHVLIDEAATLNLYGIEDFINTGRSNGMITTLGYQGFSQSDFTYGPQLAKVIMTSLGNWYYGQINDKEAINQVVDQIGNYKYEHNNKSYNKGSNSGGSVSMAQQTEKFLRFEEISEFDKGYFAGKMAEGEHSRFMGSIDVTEFEPYMQEGANQILPLSPTVTKLERQGKISKEEIAAYYQGSKEAEKAINKAVIDFSKSEFTRIRKEVDLFMINPHDFSEMLALQNKAV